MERVIEGAGEEEKLRGKEKEGQGKYKSNKEKRRISEKNCEKGKRKKVF